MYWYLKALKHYIVFSGRAHRKEYWMFFLFNILIGIAFGIIGHLLKTELIGQLYSLAMLLPSLAVLARRLHDTGRTAWWLLLSLIPLLGTVVLLIFAAIEGDQGDNEYGAYPEPNQ